MTPLAERKSKDVDFLEIAPENWLGVGGQQKKQLQALLEKYPFVCHGLSLSLGGLAPLDYEFLQDVKLFLKQNQISYYTEHLSYCSDEGHLYNLLPIPFTEKAIVYVADRIKQVQDILGQRIGLENPSYYCAPGQQISEIDFLNGVLNAADCDLLLDVNNVFVNSVNHGYDAHEFINQIVAKRVGYIHVAGHMRENENLIIDSHGDKVISPVWDLLKTAYLKFGIIPTLLERDFDVPPLAELVVELQQVKKIQQEVIASTQQQVAYA